MAGLLTHLCVAFAGFLIIYLGFYRSKKRFIYGLGFFIGHLAPDILDFGIAGIKQVSLSPAEIMTNPWFQPLAILGHTLTNWLILSIVIIIGALFFYKIDKISKKSFIAIILSLVFFLIGVFVHLQLDTLIIETNYWI